MTLSPHTQVEMTSVIAMVTKAIHYYYYNLAMSGDILKNALLTFQLQH